MYEDWINISLLIPGRTPLDCKNHYFTFFQSSEEEIGLRNDALTLSMEEIPNEYKKSVEIESKISLYGHLTTAKMNEDNEETIDIEKLIREQN